MKNFENAEMKVVINENGEGTVKVKAFNDVYRFTLTDGKLQANSSLALSKAVKARKTFGF